MVVVVVMVVDVVAVVVVTVVAAVIAITIVTSASPAGKTFGHGLHGLDPNFFCVIRGKLVSGLRHDLQG